MEIISGEDREKNKANFKAQNTLKGVKRKLEDGFLRTDDDGRQRGWTIHSSSLVNHTSHFLPCLSSAADENRETSFGSLDN
jgi:hypothetical protein